MNTFNQIKILVHSEYLIFEWAKKTVNAFNSYALKNKMELRTAFTPEKLMLSHGETVIVLGVDRPWLTDVIGKLKEYGVNIIVSYGEPCENIDNISYIRVDQCSLMRASLEHLASCGKTSTAFFGVQKNDTSDGIKARYFKKFFTSENVYPLNDSVDTAFDSFYRDAERYDSVICSNDVIAYCFMRRCRESGIQVPRDLYLVGNGDLWISSHMKPSLTTATYNWHDMIETVMSIIKNVFPLPSVCSLDIKLEASFVSRESTGYFFKHPQSDEVKQTLPTVLYDYKEQIPETDREIQMLHNLNQTLFCASVVQREILVRLARHESYEKIAEALVMSTEAVKYHAKKLYRQLDIHSKNELSLLFGTYKLII